MLLWLIQGRKKYSKVGGARALFGSFYPSNGIGLMLNFAKIGGAAAPSAPPPPVPASLDSSRGSATGGRGDAPPPPHF